MNRQHIWILSVLFLFISISCNKEKEINTRYFTVKYPSDWKADKIIESDTAFNVIAFIECAGKKTDNISYLTYIDKILDPESILCSDVKERVKYFSEEITDTIFKGLPAKKIRFFDSQIRDMLFSGEAICFNNNGVTYIIYDMYDKSIPENAGKGLSMLQKMEFKKTPVPERHDDI